MENGEANMKVIGRKGKPRIDVTTIDSSQKLANDLRKGRPFMPKGLWRFRSHEEADAWKLKMLTRPWTRHSSKNF
jgi:hypothetical protein